jgi:hypothetical protein
MKKLAVILTAISICLVLLFLLAYDAAGPNPLMVNLRKVEIGMTNADVEAIFGRPADMVLPVRGGSDLNVWLGGRDDKASVVILHGRVTGRAWAPSNETIVERIQYRLGMPWWEHEKGDALLFSGEYSVTAGSTIFRLEDPKIEAVFPGKHKVEIVPDGRQVILEDDKTVYLLHINKLPTQVSVLDDPGLAKKLIDVSRDGALQFQKGVTGIPRQCRKVTRLG